MKIEIISKNNKMIVESNTTDGNGYWSAVSAIIEKTVTQFLRLTGEKEITNPDHSEE